MVAPWGTSCTSTDFIYTTVHSPSTTTAPLPLSHQRSAKMVAGSFTVEYQSPVSVERLWKGGVCDGHILAPKILPEVYASIDVVEGDGGVGTIMQFNFTEAVEGWKFITERFDVIDEENHTVKYTVVGGGLLHSRLKAYSFEVKFEAADNGGSKGKVTVDYDTISDSPLTEEERGKLTFATSTTLKALESYLQENPNLYA